MNVKKFFKGSIIVAFLVALGGSWLAPTEAQQATIPGIAETAIVRTIKFNKLKKVEVPVLKKPLFLAKFGANQDIPKTNAGVINLARKIYSPRGKSLIKEESGEYIYGTLYAALSNPDISKDAVNEVNTAADADLPALPRTYTRGHFKFYYTTNDSNPNNNVTLSDIRATAIVLNNAWNDYAANFKEPKHYVSNGRKLIDVYVYYLGSSLYGVTSSSWNYIELNSKHVVRNPIKRQTTPVHELFHRVQYRYGYISGTAGMKWGVEGTASWSQKYRAPHIGDWMDRMNQGLALPDYSLLKRSYNACHYWVYLGQRAGNERDFIKKVWSTYETNGKKLKKAVNTAIKAQIGSQYNFDTITGWWLFANFYKDVQNAAAGFDYQEDELIRNLGSAIYGPLREVPRTTRSLSKGSNLSFNGRVAAYGADYYVFNLNNKVGRVDINVSASSKNFGYAVIELKNQRMVHYRRTPSGGRGNYAYSKTFTPGSLSQVVLVVMGNPGGGNYAVQVQGKDAAVVALDPNEASVVNSRDFKKLSLLKSGVNLEAAIEFYANPNITYFFFYADVNNDQKADVLVRCYKNRFEVYKATRPGLHNNKVFTGTPTLSGKKYQIKFPWTTAFGNANKVNFWLYDMGVKDRLPNSGSVILKK